MRKMCFFLPEHEANLKQKLDVLPKSKSKQTDAPWCSDGGSSSATEDFNHLIIVSIRQAVSETLYTSTQHASDLCVEFAVFFCCFKI